MPTPQNPKANIIQKMLTAAKTLASTTGIQRASSKTAVCPTHQSAKHTRGGIRYTPMRTRAARPPWPPLSRPSSPGFRA